MRAHEKSFTTERFRNLAGQTAPTSFAAFYPQQWPQTGRRSVDKGFGMDDHGMTATVGDPYFTNMERRYRLDVPPITVHRAPADIAAFINDLSNSPSVTKPIRDLYIATHASSDGFLFVRLFRGAVDVNGDPTDVTDYEVIGQAVGGTTPPAKIPNSLIGYVSGPPTHNVHIKGCNIGRTRHRSALQPPAPFLVRLKQAFGNNVNVTAPKHFHGLLPETSHSGIFEYMCRELIVATPAVKTRRGFRGFADRAALITAFQNATLSYHDGTLVPPADWETLVPPRVVLDRNVRRSITMNIPLGQTVQNMTSVNIDKQYRVDTERVDWVLPAGTFPADEPGRLAALRASITADPRFANNHPWPMWERRRFNNFNDYWAGHHWSVSRNRRSGELVCVGRRFVYTIVEPIVNRTVNPPANRPLIFNFYPGPGSTQAAILTGLVENNNTFFGRA